MSSCRPKFFRVHYRDFSRKSVIKYWRHSSTAAARQKAEDQGNCREVVTITELTAEQYEAEAQTNRKTTQFLRNTRRHS